MYRATAPADGTAGATSRWATREIAALDFLTSIPLESEESIVRAGLSNTGAGGGVAVAGGVGADGSIGLAAVGALDHVTVGGQPHASSAAVAGSADPRWWERVINKGEIAPIVRDTAAARARLELEEKELERPSEELRGTSSATTPEEMQADAVALRSALHPTPSQQTLSSSTQATPATAPRVAPGRRLEGREATLVAIPRDVLTVEMLMSHRTGVARQAAIREWEIRTAHCLPIASDRTSNLCGGQDDDYDEHRQGLLDGRAFLSAKASYPAGVFSVIKYEPRKEEAARRRKKLEERGGGGTQFVMPERDWRGISYRALLPRVHKKNHGFRRTLRERRRSNRREACRRMSGGEQHSVADATATTDDESSADHDETASMSSSSSEDSDGYVPGFVDDPAMVQGRHRHVMVGDRATGCVVSSTIQFVQPSQLKADLNKQFKERFDGWEPAKEQRKYIGAKVIDGVYTLSDPTEFPGKDGLQRKKSEDDVGESRRRKGSTSAEVDTIRMPPSLTLSKIRRLKLQALIACVRAKMEVSTVALACVYFERLALDCRVDKSNRRLVFAACLLLAAKMNERNSHIVHAQSREVSAGQREETKRNKILPSFIKPTETGKNQFASLLDFFAHDWGISLKSLFAAEFGVFAALGFNLQAKPSHVAFHFKRFMKSLEWNSVAYLGQEQYNQWQRSIDDEEVRKDAHLDRKHMRRKQEEKKLLDLQRDYHKKQQEEEKARRRGSPSYISDSDSTSSHKQVVGQVADSSGAENPPNTIGASSTTPAPAKPLRGRGTLRRPSAGTMKSFIPTLRRGGGVSRQSGASTGTVFVSASSEHLDKLAHASHDAVGIPGASKTSSMRRSQSTPSMRNLEAVSQNPNVAIDINTSLAVGMERILEVRSLGREEGGNEEEEEAEYSIERSGSMV